MKSVLVEEASTLSIPRVSHVSLLKLRGMPGGRSDLVLM